MLTSPSQTKQVFGENCYNTGSNCVFSRSRLFGHEVIPVYDGGSLFAAGASSLTLHGLTQRLLPSCESLDLAWSFFLAIAGPRWTGPPCAWRSTGTRDFSLLAPKWSPKHGPTIGTLGGKETDDTAVGVAEKCRSSFFHESGTKPWHVRGRSTKWQRRLPA